MPPPIPSEAQPESVHCIDGPLNIYSVTHEHLRLLDYIENTDTLRIDLSGVSECDAAGLQLLCSLYNSAKLLQRNLQFINYPDELRSIAQLAGLPEQLLTTTASP